MDRTGRGQAGEGRGPEVELHCGGPEKEGRGGGS